MAWTATIDGQLAGTFRKGDDAYDAILDAAESGFSVKGQVASANLASVNRALARCSIAYIGPNYSYQFYSFRTLYGAALGPWFRKWCGNIMPPREASWLVCENPGHRLGEVIAASETASLPKAVHEMHTQFSAALQTLICFDVSLFNGQANAMVTRCLVRATRGHQNPSKKR